MAPKKDKSLKRKTDSSACPQESQKVLCQLLQTHEKIYDTMEGAKDRGGKFVVLRSKEGNDTINYARLYEQEKQEAKQQFRNIGAVEVEKNIEKLHIDQTISSGLSCSDTQLAGAIKIRQKVKDAFEKSFGEKLENTESYLMIFGGDSEESNNGKKKWDHPYDINKDEDERINNSPSLKPSREKAYNHYQFALEKKPELAEVTDREVYDWLSNNPQTSDEIPSRFDTFAKYLREARKHYGEHKHTPRCSRETGRSIVRQDQI